MRIDEIVSAEDQIALFKLITDKVWQSLAELERAEAWTKAQQPLKATLKIPSIKKTKAPAIRPAQKLTSKTASPAKSKSQQIRVRPLAQQPQSIQAQSAKQKINSNPINEPQLIDYGDFNGKQFKATLGKERYS